MHLTHYTEEKSNQGNFHFSLSKDGNEMITQNQFQSDLNNVLAWMRDAGIMQKILKDASRAGQVPRKQREEGIKALSILRHVL